MKCAWMLNCAVLFSCAVAAAGDYAVVVSAKTRDDAGWAKVVQALSEKYPSAVILTWNRNLDELLPTLQERPLRDPSGGRRRPSRLENSWRMSID